MAWSDLRLVQQFGPHLDEWLGEDTQVRDILITTLLKIRPKRGWVQYLRLNRAQLEYSRRATKRNIVLKARQVGITTYIAARFFLQTITQPGTLTVQVAHSDESAEAIFRMVHRFWANLPNKRVHQGALLKSRSNVRQIVFPKLDSEYRIETADDNAGRGMTIHNLHCSEVSRWSRGGRDTLASLQAAVVPDGEIVLESTPNGASGMFYEEWQKAEEMGYTKHFFPWWYEPTYKLVGKGPVQPLTDEEQDLVTKHGLTEEQIAWRRMKWKDMRAQAAQEFAELHGHLPPYELARKLVELGHKYENALIAVERNNHGYGVLAHLQQMKYENLFQQNNQDGWLTSAVTRPAMIENLASMLMTKPELFHSPRLLQELRTFVRRPDGQAAASDGAHDDCVMAMAIAQAVRREDAGRVKRR